MGRMKRVLTSGLLGALVCAVLCWAAFFLMAIIDGARIEEALGFGLAVGVAGAFFGALIGFIVGAGNLGPVGGGMAGLLATAAAVAFYVLVFGRPDALGYFLRESVVVVAVLAVPFVITGIATAWLKNARSGKQA